MFDKAVVDSSKLEKRKCHGENRTHMTSHYSVEISCISPRQFSRQSKFVHSMSFGDLLGIFVVVVCYCSLVCEAAIHPSFLPSFVSYFLLLWRHYCRSVFYSSVSSADHDQCIVVLSSSQLKAFYFQPFSQIIFFSLSLPLSLSLPPSLSFSLSFTPTLQLLLSPFSTNHRMA